MSEEKKGIEEALEILEGIKAVGVPLKAALADGKINALDLPHALALLKNHEILIQAIEGAGNIPAEAKDIDSQEAVIIASKVFEVIKAIKEAK